MEPLSDENVIRLINSMKSESIHVLIVESDPSNARAIEFYLRGFSRKGLQLSTLSRLDEVYGASRQTWDVILIDYDNQAPEQLELIDATRALMANLPTIRLGRHSDNMITSGAETALDEYIKKVSVSTPSMLRSVSHLLERRRLEDQVESMREQLATASRGDAITGLWNQSYLVERMSEEFNFFLRYHTPLTLCLFSIARWDYIIDTYGYLVGEDVMRGIGRMVIEAKRQTDFAGRIDSDVFCVAFPKTPIEGALVPVERLRDKISHELFTGKASENFTLQARFAIIQGDPAHSSFEEFLSTARQTLQQANDGPDGHIEILRPDSDPADQAEAS